MHPEEKKSRLTEFFARSYNGAIVTTAVLLMLIAGGVYMLLGRQASDALVEQMLRREQIAARGGARALETFFDLFGHSLKGLAQSDAVQNSNERTQDVLDEFADRWADHSVAGVVFTDDNGTAIYNGTRSRTPETGADLSDRRYFIWSKTAKKGETYISEPVLSRLGSSKGKQIVVMATPIINGDGEFVGVLAASILLDELTRNNLDPLKVTEETRVYLIDKNGVLLSSSLEHLVGVNYLDYIRELNFPGRDHVLELLTSRLESGEEGKLDIVLPDEMKSGFLTRFLVAHSPVRVGGSIFVLAVVTPASDTLVYLTPFYLRDLGVVLLGLFAFMILAIRIAKITGYKEGVKFERQFHGENGDQESGQ